MATPKRVNFKGRTYHLIEANIKPAYIKVKGAIYKLSADERLTLVRKFSESDHLYKIDPPKWINVAVSDEYGTTDDWDDNAEYVRIVVARPREGLIIVEAIPAEKDGGRIEGCTTEWGSSYSDEKGYYDPDGKEWEVVNKMTLPQIIEYHLKEGL